MMGSSSSWSTPAFGSFMSGPTYGRPTDMFRPPMPHQAPFPSPAFGATTGQPYSSAPAFGVSSMPSPFGSFDRVSEQGSRVSAYSKTTDGDASNGCLQSISAMPVYNSKSHEELRHEDYQRGDKGSFSLQNSTAPWANHPWQPQLPQEKPLTHLSEAHVKPSVGLQSSTQGPSSTTNPFWLRSGGPQPPLFSFPPEPNHESLFPSSSFAHPWQPQLPVKPLTDLSEAHVKPSVGVQSSTEGPSSTTNQFWLRSGRPQRPLFSFPPEPVHKSLFPSSSSAHPWQPQLPVKPLTHLSEAHAKPSEGLQSSTQGLSTSNPFWLHSAGPQPPLFSFPPEPIHKSLFSSSSLATSTCQENIFSNIAAFTAPADTSFTQGHMFHQNLFPAKSTQSGGSLLSSSVTHSAPAPSPCGQCTTINIDHHKKTVELLLPIDITTVRIRFYPRNDDAGSLASQVHQNVQASATPVSFSIYPGENQDLTIQSLEQPAKSQTGKTSSSTGPAEEQKRNICDVPLTERSPFGAPGCKVINESVLPRLYKADYYTLPSIAELAARECQEPGCCSHVKDFTVGRHGYGSVKFDGETDVRKLDITSIMEFKDREINVYTDESKRPPVGQELNKSAEITLLNVKCVDQKTGLQLMEGPAVDAYKEILTQWTKSHDAEFISFDAVKGEWKFKVKHF